MPSGSVALDAFRERDELLSLAEASAGIGIWDFDVAAGMLRGTAQFFRIMGLEPTTEPVSIEVTRALRHPDDQARVLEGYRNALSTGQDYFECEYRIIRPDGELRWIAGRARIARDAAGVPVRYSGVDLDITARKAAEAALRESEERLRLVFDQSPLGKAIAGLDFRFRSVNPALCRMLGYASDELVGQNFLECIYPDDRARCAAMGRALIMGEVPQIQLEERFVRKSGEPIWVSVNVGPIRDINGTILYTLGIIENIDERKQIAQALADSERRLRQLNEELGRLAEERERQLTSSRARIQSFFDNSPDWLTLQRQTPDGRFVYVDINPACETAYGLSRDQVIGRPVEEILGPDGAKVPLRHLHECLRTGQMQRYVAKRTMAGQTRTIDVAFVLVPDQAPGGAPFILTTARDITDRERLEAQLRQAQKMEAVGQLTGGVAHDFNNLLAVIGGSAELVRRHVSEGSRRHIDNIMRAVERGVSLTRQLLSFSRRHAATPQLIDFAVEISRIHGMLRTSLRGDIELRIQSPDGIWPVEVDLAELEIALLNIAVNARDAMPNGGVFEIRLWNDTTDHVVIELRDNGVGMPNDVISKAFDPFFTTKQPGEGTGLGLSQVYGFVQQAGGTVAIESEPGLGTSVLIRLPRSNKPLPAISQPQGVAEPPQMSGRVLLVEDNPQVAEVIGQMLNAMGLEVETVDRAIKALDRLVVEAPRIDLLLTDVVMPDGMNGLELAMLCREQFPLLPVLVTSGYNDAEMPSGATFPVLRKPVPFDELHRAIAGCLTKGVMVPT